MRMTMSAIATTPATTPPAIAATFELFDDELVDVGVVEVKLAETYEGNEAVGFEVGDPKGVDSGAAYIKC
jgi:hypothetical protein